MPYDVQKVRADFPILAEMINGKPLVYLDSANTSQKPRSVIDAMGSFMEHGYGPTNRSAYQLAAEATERFELTRTKLASFINARSAAEIVFTKNATEALNLVARSWGGANLGHGDAIVLTHMEHHANIVPWQMLAAEKGFDIRWVPLTNDGLLDTSNLDTLLDGAKAFSFTAMSNVLGTINPVRDLVAAAHRHGAVAIVDGCQSVPHMPTDVQAWDADFMAFSSHKMVGPSGVGMLWDRENLLEEMPPFLGGGGMIADVSTSGFTYTEPPARFEAGTPPIAEAVGLHAALTYLTGLGMENIEAHERGLTSMALETLTARYGNTVRVIGPGTVINRGSVISLDVENVHPHDLGQILDEFGVCVRPGHHCAKPLMKRFGLMATARVSFGPYSLASDLDALCAGLDKALTTFGVR